MYSPTLILLVLASRYVSCFLNILGGETVPQELCHQITTPETLNAVVMAATQQIPGEALAMETWTQSVETTRF